MASPTGFTLKQILEEIENIFKLREFMPEYTPFPALKPA